MIGYKIESYIPKRDDYFIMNNYELLNVQDDFNLIIYYINHNKIKIIIRKFNNNHYNGWNNQLIIKLYNIDDNEKFELLIVGSSKKDSKILNIKTKINIQKKNIIDLKIPKKIYQTYKNNDYHNIYHYNAVQSLLEFNPDFEYYFYNDKDCRKFIKENFSEDILNTYDFIYPCAYKADFFRYLIIYKYGGIYIDNKYIVKNSFYSIINKEDLNVLCLDVDNECLMNSLIISLPSSEKINSIIHRIVENVKNNFYGKCPLHPTGPRLFFEFMRDENIKLRHKINNTNKDYKNCMITYNENIFLNTFYDGYYHNPKHRNEIKNDYDYCFRNKLIYLNNYFKIKNYKFFIIYDKKIYFQVLLLEENSNSIKIQIIIKNLLAKNNIKNYYKFIFLNDLNHNIQNFNLNDVYNKIITIHF